MLAYWKAVAHRLGSAAIDVIFVAVISLAPILLGRLIIVMKPSSGGGGYWSFLTNGQLAFYSMGSLATLLLVCLAGKLPGFANRIVGLIAILCLLFLMVLVGVDPTLSASSFSFVGYAALYIYLGVLLLRIVTDAMKEVGPGSALAAGEKSAKSTSKDLASRKGVPVDG